MPIFRLACPAYCAGLVFLGTRLPGQLLSDTCLILEFPVLLLHIHGEFFRIFWMKKSIKISFVIYVMEYMKYLRKYGCFWCQRGTDRDRVCASLWMAGLLLGRPGEEEK
ncbi:hypothetical protein VI06_19230 [Aquitalea magnusonii]|nr:hypothetical protein VI06_19230 [Aquitalea magnusonii]